MNEMHEFLRAATRTLQVVVALLARTTKKLEEEEFLVFWEARTHAMHANGIGVIFNRSEALRFYRVYLSHKDSISKQVASEVVD